MGERGRLFKAPRKRVDTSHNPCNAEQGTSGPKRGGRYKGAIFGSRRRKAGFRYVTKPPKLSHGEKKLRGRATLYAAINGKKTPA